MKRQEKMQLQEPAKNPEPKPITAGGSFGDLLAARERPAHKPSR